MPGPPGAPWTPGGVDQLAVQTGVPLGAAPVPWKPNSVVPPAETRPLYATLANRTVPLLPLAWAFQALLTAEPDGRVSATDQPVIAADPAVSRTVVTKPPFQALTDVLAVQPWPPGAGELGGGELGGGELGGGSLGGPELDGETGGELGGGVPLFRVFSVEVYAAFLLPLPSNSSGVPLARQESVSRIPHTEMPVQRVTFKQARTTRA